MSGNQSQYLKIHEELPGCLCFSLEQCRLALGQSNKTYFLEKYDLIKHIYLFPSIFTSCHYQRRLAVACTGQQTQALNKMGFDFLSFISFSCK